MGANSATFLVTELGRLITKLVSGLNGTAIRQTSPSPWVHAFALDLRRALRTGMTVTGLTVLLVFGTSAASAQEQVEDPEGQEVPVASEEPVVFAQAPLEGQEPAAQPEEEEDPVDIPGPQGATGATGADGPAGTGGCSGCRRCRRVQGGAGRAG